MSDESTTRMLEAYEEQRVSPRMFLSSWFRTTERSFHTSDYVEVDIRRGEPHIAVPIKSTAAAAMKYESEGDENRKFLPPVYDTEATISASGTSGRALGMDSFQSPDFRLNARNKAFRVLNDIEDMQRRAVELQVSQIFQTGAISLVDKANVEIFGLDFQARPSHFVTPTAWAVDGSTGDPEGDLEGLCGSIRRNGKLRATDAIFGSGARRRFLRNAKIQKRLELEGTQRLQELMPVNVPQDAHMFGVMTVGNQKLRLWEYDAHYIHPYTNEAVTYIGDLNVVVLAEQGARELTFGAIPMFMPPEARAAQFLPARMSSVAAGFDMTTNIWVSPDGKHLTMSAGTRPLAVPKAIDTFGCLTVG